MRFDPPLVHGTLLRRYKRFLADIALADGREVTAHCANPGSMLDVAVVGRPVVVSPQDDPKRKLRWSWELIDLDGHWVCINTALPNRLVEEALLEDAIPELRGYATVQREVRYGSDGRSRIDVLLRDGAQPDAWVEIKNVTLARGRRAEFPDSVTARGQKHLHELMTVAAGGDRAVMLFWISRGDCDEFAPADDIDPEYGRLLRQAAGSGVEILAYRSRVDPEGIQIAGPIEVVL